MTERSDAGRRELGEFLRSRRERVTPESAGIPAAGRRRTPGLRREEVAALAGVGVTWYTWLEQGRPINASAQVLQAIGRTLRLDEAERRHAWTLAGLPTPDEAVIEQPGLAAAFQPVLDKLDPYPACVQNAHYDVLAYNRSYRFLFGDLDAIPPDERNCLRQFFLNPAWRSCYLDDDIVAARMTAKFRAAVGAGLDDPAVVRLVDDISRGSSEFAALWGRHDVLIHRYEVKRIQQPLVGLLQLNFVWASVEQDSGLRMSVMTPCDEITAQRLVALADRTADVPGSQIRAS